MPPRKLTLAEMQATVSAYAASDNPVFQAEREVPSAGTLWRISALSTRARTNGRIQRTALRFPTLRRVYARERRSADGLLIRKGASYAGDVWRYLSRWGFRTLNDLDGAGFAPPCHDDLAALFERRVLERGKTFYPLYSNRGFGLSTATVEQMADAASTAVLRDWSPTWIREQRERGRRGGQFSKRKPTWTDADLDALAVLEGMTVTEQARTLGVSMSTIDRMRRALRERSRSYPQSR